MEQDYINHAIETFRQIASHRETNMFKSLESSNKSELFLLSFLLKQTGAVMPTDLSNALNISTARISALLKSLQEKGYITREVSPNNRRQVLVKLTPLGEEKIHIQKEIEKNKLSRVFQEMGKEDSLTFVRLAEKFSSLMQIVHNENQGGSPC